VIAEIEALPVGYLDRIVEYRRYREAWGQFEAATTPEQRKRLRTWRMGALAEQIGMELAAERLSEAHG
jgi:hypothetical protein